MITSICPPTWLASFETFSCDLVTPSRHIAIFAALVRTWFTVKSITTFCKKKKSFFFKCQTFILCKSFFFSFRNLQIHVWKYYFNFWSAKSKEFTHRTDTYCHKHLHHILEDKYHVHGDMVFHFYSYYRWMHIPIQRSFRRTLFNKSNFKTVNV